MRKKKILFICNNANMLKEKIMPSMMVITNKGYEIDIITNEEVDIPFTCDKYIFQTLNGENFSEIKKEAKKLHELLNEKKYSVIHTFDNFSSFLLSESNYKDASTDLYVYIDDAEHSISKLKNILKIADKTIVNNENDYDYLIKKKVNVNVINIYDLAIDFRKYKSLNIEKLKEKTRQQYNLENSKKYIFVPETNKDEIYISKVISEIASQNSNIVFLFSYNNQKIYDYIQKNNMTDKVLYIENIKFLEYLLMSDSVLFTKIYSYDLMPFIYALMFGIPVILPKNKYLDKYIDELKNGFFVENKNVQQTILAIGRSINFPKLKLDELVEYNYSKISHFSVDKYIYNISQLYKEVTTNPPKDMYIIESLKKGAESERLMDDIKINGVISAEIILLENSINDEKLKSLGAEIKKFDISSFNGKYKLKKYIEKVILDNEYNSFSLYGKVNKIFKNNNITINTDAMIVNYKKI